MLVYTGEQRMNADQLHKQLTREKIGMWLNALVLIVAAYNGHWVAMGLTTFGMAFFAQRAFKRIFDLAEIVGWNKEENIDV